MPKSSMAVRVLKVVAWVALIGGILGGIGLIATAGGNQELDPATFELVERGTNAAAIAAGVFVMIYGVIAWAALMAFAEVADGVATISYDISEMKRAATGPRPAPTTPTPPPPST